MFNCYFARPVVVSVVLAGLCGCAGIDLDETPPQNFDMSGAWQLNFALSDSPSLAGIARGKARGQAGGRPQRQGRGAPPGGGGQGRGQRRRQGGGQPGGQRGQNQSNRSGRGTGGYRVAILEHDEVVIQQDYESMGMSFDRAPYRDVSWGKRVRGEETINAGWQDRELVIQTKGGRVPIVERYSLSEDGNRLTVLVELNRGRNDLTFKRVFEKPPTR